MKKVITTLLLIVCAGCATGTGISDSDKEAESTNRCQDYVKTLLKAPSTAQFSGTSSTDYGDGTFHVTGSVDAQNGFGAQIRSTWQCVARNAGDHNWSVDSGSVDDATSGFTP